ncbi:hypothetical protein AMTRI_Chr06g196260 [Amborella trichopoda]
MRKRVLELRHLFFGGSDEQNYELGLDRVSDSEMFYLVSMYFSCPNGFGIPSRVLEPKNLCGSLMLSTHLPITVTRLS